ncbi:MAG: hypothetical protein HFI37_09465, partial [Lachnospiraceae bacterium]|nr:hypothetical protein [Lachnospiraceae bacterium]
MYAAKKEQVEREPSEEKDESQEVEQQDESMQDTQGKSVASEEAEQTDSNLILPQERALGTPALVAEDDKIDLEDTTNNVEVKYDPTYSLVYNAAQKTPSVVSVRCNGEALTQGMDYTVTYGANINVGKGYIYIHGVANGKYYGTYSTEFDITELNIENATASRIPDQEYAGKNSTAHPNVTLTISGNSLTESQDYTTEWTAADGSSDVRNVGRKKVTITGKGNCTGTKEVYYNVTRKSLNNGNEFRYDYETSHPYTGTAVTPKLEIYYNNELLEEGADKDYTLTYNNNTTITSSATIRVMGQGNFTSSINLPFTIAGKTINDCDITLSETRYTYDGKAHRPDVTVMDGSKTLVEDTDYTLSYPNPTNAGDTSVVVTGIRNYSGTRNMKYTIDPCQITASDLRLTGLSSETYSGKEIKPTPSVRDNTNGRTMVSGVDFDYAYDDNINVSKNAKVIIDGKGNYTGSPEFDFEIIPRQFFNAEIEVENWRSVGRYPDSSIVRVTYNGEVLRLERDYKVEFQTEDGQLLTDAYPSGAPSNITAYVAIKEGESQNYTGTTRKPFKICGDLSKATVTCNTKYVYTGSMIKAEPTAVYLDGERLEINEDYEVKPLTDSINAGEHQMSIRGINNYAGEQTVGYTIDQKPLDARDIVCDALEVEYTGNEVTPEFTVKYGNITLSQGDDFTLEKVSSVTDYTNVTTTRGKIPINLVAKKDSSGTETGNFTGSRTVYFDIVPRAIDGGSFTAADDISVTDLEAFYEYTGTKIEPAYKVWRNFSTELQKGQDYNADITNNQDAGTATITITGINNYKGAFRKTFDIKYPLDNDNWVTSYTVDTAGRRCEEFVYEGGSPIEPGIYILFSDLVGKGYGVPTEGTGYRIVDSIHNIDATGNGPKAQITIEGIGKYTGRRTVEFTITPKDIASTDIHWGEYVSIPPYNGRAKNPQELSATFKKALIQKTPMIQNADFEITKYEDDGDLPSDPPMSDGTGSQCINAGKVTMTIQGTGNYMGTITKTFDIPPKDIGMGDVKINSKIALDKLVYDGTSHKLEADDLILTYERDTSANPMGPDTDIILNSDPNRVDYTVTASEDDGDKRDEDYTEENKKNSPCINAGIVTLTLTGEGNYEGTKELTYEIQRKSLRNSNGSDWAAGIKAEISNGVDGKVIYNREVQNPTIAITDEHIPDSEGNGTVLREGKDYKVTWRKYIVDASGTTTFQEVSECKDAGKYQIEVAGIGNYIDEYYVDYEILPRDLNNGGEADGSKYLYAIDEIEDQVYTGYEIIPESLRVFEYTCNPDDADDVSQNQIVLEKDVDYDCVGFNNINVSTEMSFATLTITGKGNYTGTLPWHFNIIPKNIEDDDVTLEEILEVPYNGLAQTPDLPLWYNGKQLSAVAGTDTNLDYTVDYNVEKLSEDGTTTTVATNIEVGPAYGVIRGEGNFTGERSYTEDNPIFRVIPRSLQKALDDGEITVNQPEEVTYDGLPHRPTIEVKDSFGRGEDVTLVEGEDYEVEYTSVVNAGTQIATVRGIGNYGDSIPITFEIKPKTITDANGFLEGSFGELIEEDWAYTGFEIKAKMHITDTIKKQQEGSEDENAYEEVVVELEEGTAEGQRGDESTEDNGVRDYVLKYEDENGNKTNINAGTAKITVVFTGNYAGTYETTFDIRPRNIEEDSGDGVVIDPMEDQQYSKEVIHPDPVITYGRGEDPESEPGYQLKKDIDYTLAYDGDCIDMGTYAVTITGGGNFEGTVTTKFKIVPRDLDPEKSPEIIVAAIPDQIYDGTNIRPTTTLEYKGEQLVEGVDYNLSAGENTRLPGGEAELVITGNGNYTGKRIEHFTIVGDLSHPDCKIERIEPQDYTGKEAEPEPTVSFAGVPLVQDENFEIVGWDNNVDVGPEAKVTIAGKSPYYTGTREQKFQISYNIAEASLEVKGIANAYTYTSDVITPGTGAYKDKKISVSYEGGLGRERVELTEGIDYTLGYQQNINTGKAEVVITGCGNYKGSQTKSFNIVKKSIATCSFSVLSNYVYDGKEKTPTVTIRNGVKTLKNGTDYTVKYEMNKDAGLGKVIVTGQNNYSGTAIRYFNITVAAPKSPKMVSNSATSIKISWTSGGKATGYEIYRQQSNNIYKKIGSTKSTTYTDKKLSNAKAYNYKVKAYYKGSAGTVYSSYTSVLKANTIPAKPKISVSCPKSKQVKIKWSKLKYVTGYEVYQSTS